jgi:hypothetical protein
MSADNDERNYEVGYGRPPQGTRFKKGQSGNPKGRPSGTKNLGGLFQQLLGEMVTAREGDRSRRMTKAEALLQALVLRAIKGEGRAVTQVFTMMREQGLLAPPEEGRSTRQSGVLVVPGVANDPVAWERAAQAYMRRQGLLPDDSPNGS